MSAPGSAEGSGAATGQGQRGAAPGHALPGADAVTLRLQKERMGQQLLTSERYLQDFGLSHGRKLCERSRTALARSIAASIEWLASG